MFTPAPAPAPAPARSLPLSLPPGIMSTPCIVFLDEPTSGLDSFAALNVMAYMRGMANKFSQTVVSSIHQPRSAIWQMFDRVSSGTNGPSVTPVEGTPCTRVVALGSGYGVVTVLACYTWCSTPCTVFPPCHCVPTCCVSLPPSLLTHPTHSHMPSLPSLPSLPAPAGDAAVQWLHDVLRGA